MQLQVINIRLQYALIRIEAFTQVVNVNEIRINAH
jgi:hypothetical protein